MGHHLPSVSLGWCPPSLKAQVFLSTLELARACTSPAGHIHPSCLSGDGLGLTLQNIAPNKTLHLVQKCLRHHSEAAKPTTDFSAKDPKIRVTEECFTPTLIPHFLKNKKYKSGCDYLLFLKI